MFWLDSIVSRSNGNILCLGQLVGLDRFDRGAVAEIGAWAGFCVNDKAHQSQIMFRRSNRLSCNKC